MKTEHTLRYLLLRHLEPFGTVVPEARLREVTDSLRVEAERGGWRVTWTARGEAHERRFEREAFSFYTRGDTRPEQRSLDDALATENDRRAREFAEAVLDRPSPLRETPAPVPREPHARRAQLADAVFALGVGSVGGLGPANGAALLAVALAEHLRFGRLAAAGGLVLLALVGPPIAALLLAAVYGVLQLLDPDADWRRLRVGLCATAVGVATLAAAAQPPGWAPAAGLLAGLAGTGIALVRWLHASHYRALPLALPFYCVGLALEGRATAAAVGLALLAAATLLSTQGVRRSSGMDGPGGSEASNGPGAS